MSKLSRCTFGRASDPRPGLPDGSDLATGRESTPRGLWPLWRALLPGIGRWREWAALGAERHTGSVATPRRWRPAVRDGVTPCVPASRLAEAVNYLWRHRRHDARGNGNHYLGAAVGHPMPMARSIVIRARRTAI